MVQYKFNYFNLRGRGEIVRLMFAATGQAYEDFRIERDQWPNYKKLSPTGQCPYLEVIDGDNSFILCQSVAITRYLARKFNLAGKGEREQAEADMYADQVTDFLNEMVKQHMEQDPERKKQLAEKFEKETAPNNLKLFEERLAKNGTGYLIGSGLTYTDIYLVSLIDWFGPKREETLSHFANLKKLDETVRANKGIAAWLASRPKTDM